MVGPRFSRFTTAETDGLFFTGMHLRNARLVFSRFKVVHTALAPMVRDILYLVGFNPSNIYSRLNRPHAEGHGTIFPYFGNGVRAFVRTFVLS